MDHRLIGLLALGGCVENGASNRTWLSSVYVMMVAVGRRQRLDEWADQRDIAGPPTPRWLVWLTATWPRTIGLAVLVGAWGFVRTAIGSGGWGFGDDIAGLLGGIGAALFIRVAVRRRERLRRDAAAGPARVASPSD